MSSPGKHVDWRNRVTHAAGLGAIFAAALWSAWSMLDRYFVGDDFGYVARFLNLPFAEWPGLFVREWSGGLWGFELRELRPFAALSFMIDGRLWGANPLGFHLTNLFLDAACGCLVAAIVWRVYPSKIFAGAAAGVLFALHPAHAETVAWITGRVDVLATAAYLGGFWSAISWLETRKKRWMILAWSAYLVGVFSKEFCLTLPLLVGIYAGIYRDRLQPGAGRRLLVVFVGFLIVFAAYSICRHVAFAGNVGNGQSANPFKLNYLKRQFLYVGWMLPPIKSLVETQAGRGVPWAFLAGMGAAVFAALVFAVSRIRAKSEPETWRAAAFFGLAWYLLATLPLVVVGYFSPRHLYFATAGFSVAVTLLIDGLIKSRWLRQLAVIGFAVWSASVFLDAVRLWRMAAKVSERFAVATAAEPVPAKTQIWIIDAPGSYFGAWCWAWATPMALQEPFQRARDVAVLEAPEVYIMPHQWRERLAAAKLAERSGAVLFSLDTKGQVERRNVPVEVLNAAGRELGKGLQSGAEMDAWKRFVQALKEPAS